MQPDPNITAQSAAWFAFSCLVIIGVSMWWDMRKEEKERKRSKQATVPKPKPIQQGSFDELGPKSNVKL